MACNIVYIFSIKIEMKEEMNKITITNVFWKYNAIGVDTRKIADENIINVTIKDKHDNLMYPNDYYITKKMLKERDYLVEKNNEGVQLVYIPTKDLINLVKEDEMTQEEKDIDLIFKKDDPFEVERDPRIKTAGGGYTKIEDGQTVRMRFTMNMYRFYKFTPDDAIMPLQNAQAKELLEEKTLDEIFDDQTIKVSEGYCAIIWNYETDQAEVWQFSRTVFEMLRTLQRDSDWEGGLKDNDVKVTRTGKKTDTRYSIVYCKKSNDITDKAQEILDVPVERMVAGAERL